jgi:hypothetical protein
MVFNRLICGYLCSRLSTLIICQDSNYILESEIIAFDRAEIVGMNQTISVPAGNFNNVIKIKETNALEPKVTQDNLYTPGVGLVFDHNSKLVSYGYLK